MHPQFGLCTLLLVLHSSLTMNVNSSKAMNPACRPHSKRRSAADSFGWPSTPSVGSSGSRRNLRCPPGSTWEAHQGKQPATGTGGSQGMIMATTTGCLKPPVLHLGMETGPFLGATQRPKLIFALLVPRLSQECDTRPELKSNKWQMSRCVCKIVDGFTTENRSSTADLAWGHADKNVEKDIQTFAMIPP